MIFTLPDLPDGKKCRLESDKHQWCIRVFEPYGESHRWKSIKYCSSVPSAAQTYVDYAIRLSPITDDLDEAKRFVNVLVRDLTVCLGSIGIEVLVRTDDG